MKSHSVNDSGGFICGWFMEDLSLCDRITEFHQSRPNVRGQTYAPLDGSSVIDLSVKDSYETKITDSPELMKEYVAHLQATADEYMKVFPYCNAYAAWGVKDAINIQEYKPGGGFFTYHTERVGAFEPSVSRHLVFMTYLNDVEVGGETEFLHQKLKVKPRKGLTIIWPADWTHTHRGIAAPDETKIIVTGWFNFA